MQARNLEREYSPTLSQSPEIYSPESSTGFPARGSVAFGFERKTLPYVPVELYPGLRVNHRLEKARFSTRMEMRRFISDINTYLSQGESLDEAVALSTRVFEDHIKSYDAEIIQQNPVLLHLNRFGMWNGEIRMLGNNGRPAVEGVSGMERGGAVRRSSMKIEDFLLAAANSSFIVLMSPQGASGYLDENGQDIPHLNTQTMVFWKDQKGYLKGITLVTDLTVEQSEKVMEILGAPTNFFSRTGFDRDRVANIVENLAAPSLPQSYKNPFEYVFDKIIAVRGTEAIRLKQKKGVELRSVEDVRAEIVRYKNLLSFGLPEFREFILKNPDTVRDFSFQQAIAEKAEETILLLADEYLDKANPPVMEDNRNYQQVMPEGYFARALAFLETRGGCPTGSAGALGGGSLGSEGTLTLEADDFGSLEFFCPKCKGKNRRPRGGFVENCQKCGTDKVYCNKPTKQPKEQEKELAKAA